MKQYLGDSVYAEMKNGQLTLTTENGYGPTNTIILEPETYVALNQCVTAWLKTGEVAVEAEGGDDV